MCITRHTSPGSGAVMPGQCLPGGGASSASVAEQCVEHNDGTHCATHRVSGGWASTLVLATTAAPTESRYRPPSARPRVSENRAAGGVESYGAALLPLHVPMPVCDFLCLTRARFGVEDAVEGAFDHFDAVWTPNINSSSFFRFFRKQF